MAIYPLLYLTKDVRFRIQANQKEMYGAYRTTRFVADADRSYALVATRDYSSQCMSVPFAELPNLSREFITLLCDSHLRRRFDGAPLGPQRHLSLRTSF